MGDAEPGGFYLYVFYFGKIKKKSMESGLVSIITPAFNSSQLIGQTIESVLGQTYLNWEMLIVLDSGTTDNTAEIVGNYGKRDSRIKLFEIKDQRGISLSRNLALSKAQGEFVAFLDSDDLWLPEKLQKQIEFMIENHYAFSCTGYRKVSQDGLRSGKLRLPPSVQSYSDILANNLICCPTVVFNQKILGSFKMAEHPHEDFILWLNIVRKAESCHGLQRDLARYRVVENSRSMTVNRPASRWTVYRNFEKLGLLDATFYFIRYAISALKKRSIF